MKHSIIKCFKIFTSFSDVIKRAKAEPKVTKNQFCLRTSSEIRIQIKHNFPLNNA